MQKGMFMMDEVAMTIARALTAQPGFGAGRFNLQTMPYIDKKFHWCVFLGDRLKRQPQRTHPSFGASHLEKRLCHMLLNKV